MLYSYEELPIVFEFLGAVEVSIRIYQKVVIKKKKKLNKKNKNKKTYQLYSMQYLGIYTVRQCV